MKLKLAHITVSLVLVFSILAAPVYAQDSNWIPVYLDTEQVVFDEQPFSTGSRIMVGLRAVFEAFGSDVYWNGDLQKITSSNGDTPLEFVVGSTTYWIGGVAYVSDAAPMAVNGRTFVPLRLIAECYEARVYWNSEVESVFIFSKDYTPKSDSAQEKESNDSFQTAYKFYPGQTVSGKFNNLKDVDYYKLWVDVEGSYMFSTEPGNDFQIPAFEVFDALQQKMATSAAGADKIHRASVDLQPGFYYVRVTNLEDVVLEYSYKLKAETVRQ